jgi:hypothetical protein
MDILSKNERSIYHKRSGMFKSIVFLILFIVGALFPVIILSTSSDPKSKFFAYTICYSFWGIVIFLMGLLFVFLKIDKNDEFVRVAKIRILGVMFLVISILFIIPAYSYCKDIPVIIRSDYSYFEGNLTNFHFTVGRVNSTTLIFNDKIFKINYKVSPQFTVIGKKYYIKFLPNSKFVMSLKTTTTNDILKQYH